jgi:hypothetical protein
VEEEEEEEEALGPLCSFETIVAVQNSTGFCLSATLGRGGFVTTSEGSFQVSSSRDFKRPYFSQVALFVLPLLLPPVAAADQSGSVAGAGALGTAIATAAVAAAQLLLRPRID